MINKLLVLFTSLFLLACEKEYFPDENSYRDEALFGTWIRLQLINTENPSIEVYTEEGYCGSSVSYNNAQSNYEVSFQGLNGIWYVEEKDTKNDFEHNRIHSKNRFRKGIWEHTEEYYFKNDTLFLRDLRYEWDTLVKYKYQLKYDGPNYVGLDSIN